MDVETLKRGIVAVDVLATSQLVKLVGKVTEDHLERDEPCFEDEMHVTTSVSL